MNSKIDVRALLPWSEPQEIQTKYGPRLLRKACPTEEFWAAWKQSKPELKAAGVSCSRNFDGQWEACWWQELPKEVIEQRKAAIEASRAVSADIELPHPEGLDYMPFQKAGIRYALNRPGVLIADEMGLGKTIQAIGIINADPSIKTVLVICPKSLKLNWYREMQKWLVRPALIGIANGDYPAGAEIMIMNYEAVRKYADRLQEREWDIVIVDEAHYIKNPKALRSKAVKGIKARRRVRLTGTPIVNRPAELYNIIDDLGYDWGGYHKFSRRYCGWDGKGAQNLDELQRRLRETIMVRRLKADVLTELPAKIRQIVEVEADTLELRQAIAREQAFEDASEDRLADLRAAVELSKAENEEAYKAAVLRLREAEQVDFTEMSRLRHETALLKAPAVIAHIENALEGDPERKIIIAAHHRDVIDELAMGLIQYGVVALTGETKEADRQAAVDRFQTDPRTRIFIASIQAAGVGITLTASSHVVFAELDWVPGNITQMEDRAHRIGQKDTVLVQHIVINGSLDARMARTLVAKQNIIDNALDKDHPERKAPAYEPKAKASTHDAKPDLLAKIAERLDDAKIAAVHAGLRYLAGLDTDHASKINDIGFSKIDVRIGHELAGRATLTPRQAALGAKMIKKYHRQLPEEINIIVQEVVKNV